MVFKHANSQKIPPMQEILSIFTAGRIKIYLGTANTVYNNLVVENEFGIQVNYDPTNTKIYNNTIL